MKSLSRTLGVCATLFAVTTATVSLPAMAGIVDTQTLATQADLQTQRNDVRAGMPVCAVLLGANPESFRPKDIACPTAGQRGRGASTACRCRHGLRRSPQRARLR